jgi:hypothetical protein
MTMTSDPWPEDLDVECIPVEDHDVPRHRLAPGVVVALCQQCGRSVIRWSLMSPTARAVMAGEIREEMASVRKPVRYPEGTPEYAEYVAKLKTELRKWVNETS